MVDLFHNPSWNFSFSHGSASVGTMVLSFARYDPSKLYALQGQQPQTVVEPLTHDERVLMRLRCMKVLAHEVLHMFGLRVR